MTEPAGETGDCRRQDERSTRKLRLVQSSRRHLIHRKRSPFSHWRRLNGPSGTPVPTMYPMLCGEAFNPANGGTKPPLYKKRLPQREASVRVRQSGSKPPPYKANGSKKKSTRVGAFGDNVWVFFSTRINYKCFYALYYSSSTWNSLASFT